MGEAAGARVAAVEVNERATLSTSRAISRDNRVRFLIDSGAERSAIEANVLTQLSEKTRAQFRKCSFLFQSEKWKRHRLRYGEKLIKD